MRGGLLATGIVALGVGILLFVIAPLFPVETVIWFIRQQVPNPYLLWSGIGLGALGFLLIVLGIALPKKVPGAPPAVPQKPAPIKREEEVDVIKILKKSFKSLVKEPGFILLYLLPFTIVCIAFVHFWTILGIGSEAVFVRFRSFSEFVDFVKPLLVWIFVYGVGIVITMLAAQGAIISKAGAMERGQSMGLGDALARGVRCVPKLFAAAVLVLVIVAGPLFVSLGLLSSGIAAFAPLLALLGVILLLGWIIPMIYVGVRLSPVAQACVLEDLGPVGGIRECWRVTKGNFWLIFVTMFLLAIPSLLLNQISHVGFLISMLVITPPGWIALTLLYLGIKATKPKAEIPGREVPRAPPPVKKVKLRLKVIPREVEKKVYEYLVRARGEIDISECAKELGISVEGVEAAIESLKEKGKIEVE